MSVRRVANGRAALVMEDRRKPQGVPNVKKLSLVFALAACLLAARPAPAQPLAAAAPVPAPSAATPPTIVLLDLEAAMKAHPIYKAEKERIEAQAKTLESQMQAEAQNLMKLREALTTSTLKPGTPEYRTEEEKILRRKTDATIKFEMAQKELQQADAKIYYRIYTEIQKEAADICQANHFTMVLRFRSQQPNPDKPETLAAALNQSVIYHSGVDITGHLIDRLKKRYESTATGNNRPGVGGIR
jgi:Skp family chaperone for outer membrane proteins